MSFSFFLRVGESISSNFSMSLFFSRVLQNSQIFTSLAFCSCCSGTGLRIGCRVGRKIVLYIFLFHIHYYHYYYN